MQIILKNLTLSMYICTFNLRNLENNLLNTNEDIFDEGLRQPIDCRLWQKHLYP